MKRIGSRCLTIWLLLNLTLGLFLSINLVGLVKVNADDNDVAAPVVTIISPENTTYSTTSVDLNFTVNEATSGFLYNLDGVGNVSISGNVTLNGLFEGSHNVVVYANDTALNTGKSDTVYFFVDTTPPTIIVSSPTSSIYSTLSIPLTFSVNETVSWMGYSLDGQNNITISGNTTILGLSENLHDLVVYANDTVGNMGVSSTVNFAVQLPPVDTTPPTIIITSPQETTYSKSEVDLTFTINEPVSWIAYSRDDGETVTINGNTVLSGFSDGEHKIKIFAKDNAGNTGISNTISFKVDTTPPFVTITSPEETTYQTNNVLLDFSVDEQVSWMGYTLDGENYVTVTGDIVLVGLSDGNHSVVVLATDFAGNTGESDVVEFVVSVPSPDTTPPKVVIVSLENTTYNTNNITLTFTVNEESSVTYYSLDGEANVTVDNSTVLSNLSDGEHQIIIYAQDLSGNIGASEVVAFIISPENTSQLWIVGLLAVIACAGFIFTGYGLYDLFKSPHKQSYKKTKHESSSLGCIQLSKQRLIKWFLMQCIKHSRGKNPEGKRLQV